MVRLAAQNLLGTDWPLGKLRVERKFKSGLKLVETYAVSVDPHLLTVSAKVDASRTTNRVYEPRDPAGDGR